MYKLFCYFFIGMILTCLVSLDVILWHKHLFGTTTAIIMIIAHIMGFWSVRMYWAISREH